MTIKRGEPWGEVVAVTRVPQRVRRDGDIATHLRSDSGPLLLVDGDIALAVGARNVDGIPNHAIKLPMDSYDLEWHCEDGTVHRTTSYSTLVHGSWWRGESRWFSSGGFVNRYDVLPRSHPNDGVAEVLRIDPTMPLRQRIAANRRMRTGSHMPHPHLQISRGTSHSWNTPEPLRLVVDGASLGMAVSVVLTVRPDSWFACIFDNGADPVAAAPH